MCHGNEINILVTTLKQLLFSKLSECLEQNVRKKNDCQRALVTEQMRRPQNIRIVRRKKIKKCNQVRLVLAVFAFTFITK